MEKKYLDDSFIFWKFSWGNINNLHNLPRKKKKKKFIREYNFKKLFLEIFIKIKKNNQIITLTTNPQTPNNTSISRAITPKAA